MTDKVVVVSSVRNEEKYIEQLLESLLKQTIKPELIVITDDGSTDKTTKIIKSFKKKGVHLIHRPGRVGGPSMLGTPMMAIPFNLGFNYIRENKIYYDFVMVVGADNYYEEDYIEKMIQKFRDDPLLMVASGHQGEATNIDHARGGGRLIRKEFWTQFGAQYPFPAYLWESGINFTAKMKGYKVRCFYDVKFTARRKSGSDIDMMKYGQTLRAINYPILISIGRVFRIIQKNGMKSGIRFLAGYFMSPVQRFKFDQEIGEYLSKHLIVDKVRALINKII